MAAFVSECYKNFFRRNYHRLKPFLQQQSIFLNISNARKNHMFKHLTKTKEHDSVYSYEVSKDPEEWKFVEKLMPLETVPVPTPKPNYPSGWRPSTDEALNHPYYVERSKNHMLSVYLKLYNRGMTKVTHIRKIHGDLWRLHNELKADIEAQVGKNIHSFVHEGNNVIQFKGDYVYYVEQWLLGKGF